MKKWISEQLKYVDMIYNWFSFYFSWRGSGLELIHFLFLLQKAAVHLNFCDNLEVKDISAVPWGKFWSKNNYLKLYLGV